MRHLNNVGIHRHRFISSRQSGTNANSKSKSNSEPDSDTQPYSNTKPYPGPSCFRHHLQH